MIVMLMGVAGSGKTTIGELLSEKTGWPFFDADTFHPRSNVELMEKGIALTDKERAPWLQNIHTKMVEFFERGEDGIFACSALKKEYREVLKKDLPGLFIAHLHGDKDTIRGRVATRKGHFMPASLVDSQFATLEMPDDALILDVHTPPEEIVKAILQALPKG